MAAPTDYILYLPLYRSDMKGTSITSKDTNAYVCTVTGATWSPQGRTFTGGDDYIEFTASALNFGASDFTLLAWVRRGAGNLRTIVCHGADSATGFRWRYSGAGRILLATSQAAAIQTTEASTDLVLGVWTQVGMVRVGATVTPYLNGVPDSIWAAGTHINPTNVAGATQIGIYSDLVSDPWYGDIGEVRAFNRALTATEISDTYTETQETYKAAPVRVFIDNTRVKIRNSQINIDSRIDERSVANFTVVDTPGTASYDRAQPVNIYDNEGASTGTAIFSGFIDTPDAVVLSPSGALLHDISCFDNHYLADKRIAAKIWSNKSSASMVTELITDYLAAEGISAGTIQTGITLDRVVANYVPVTDVIDAIAAANGFIWYINSDKILNFMDRTTNTASFSLTASNVLNNPSPKYSKGNQQYRNIQWLRGGTDTTNQTETFLGDGVIKSFVVGFPINASPSVLLNSASKSVGIKGVDSGRDFYWNKGDPVVYAEASPSSNASVQVQYVGRYKTITMVRDDVAVGSQLTVEGSGTGQVENTIVNTDLDSRGQAEEFGQAKLTQWGRNAEKFLFSTRTGGLKAGQLLNVTFSPFGFASYDMLVESVNTVANDEELRYNVTAVTGPVMGSWASFFKDFQRQTLISLGNDEQVILLRQRKETLSFTETATTYSDSISSGIVNRWLNAAPISRGSLDNVQHEVMAASETAEEIFVNQSSGFYWA